MSLNVFRPLNEPYYFIASNICVYIREFCVHIAGALAVTENVGDLKIKIKLILGYLPTWGGKVSPPHQLPC